MSNTEATDKRHLEQQIDQLLDRHRASLDRLSSAQLRSLARRFNTGDGQKRWTCMRWTGRLLLCLTAAAALLLTLSLELVAGGYATQSTAWLAASDLYVQKLFRRVSHSLRLYDTEAGRNLGGCLLANPFNRRPQPLCCGCGQPAVTRVRVDQANLTAVAQLIDSLYSRVVKPFQVAGTPAMPRWPSDEAEVDFAALASFVAENRPDFERGGNQLETLPMYQEGRSVDLGQSTVRCFKDLFPARESGPARAELPPPGQVLLWSFHHLSAIRALRRLVPRPRYFGQRTERMGAVSLLLAGRALPPGRLFSAGDFAERRQLAFALPLSGRLTARLAPKAACCDGDKPPQSAPIDLAPGRALIFPTDCYELLVGRPPAADGTAGLDDRAALVQIGFIYNGAHPAKRKQPRT
ncbi:hypothetical protein BOX15_Mlig025425g1 [Macrostomum lignano]|uniref:Uncharacterized protein n=1 Tax=Macrostomum lignano TaxID=282301 RepID=A0A267DDX7_9PLAT|nr:hypothetical protein BOX15_Mlig025425g1 [Macrostomum lignano]